MGHRGVSRGGRAWGHSQGLLSPLLLSLALALALTSAPLRVTCRELGSSTEAGTRVTSGELGRGTEAEAGVGREGRALQQEYSNRGEGYWSVKGTDYVDSNGQTVRFSGIIWSGFEVPNAVFGGLDKRPYWSHIDQIRALGFNMVRIPFAGDTLLSTTYPGWGKIAANPELEGMSSLEILDKMIYAFGMRGIKVILDYHRMRLTWDNEIGTWWDVDRPESVWIENWRMLANRYKGNPTVIGADLYNEIHPNKVFPDGAPYWKYDAGVNETYNFRSAVLRVMKVIHEAEPNWIIFVEGMWNGPYWWGGNVMKLMEAQIQGPPGKLAYSSHDYGPYVAPLNWFYEDNFPDNLIPLMRKNWGRVIEKGIAPVWVGEFGSFYPKNDSDLNYRERATFEQQIKYIGQLKASWTIAFWGPDTKDTGSILNPDWFTVNEEKMRLLSPIMYPNFQEKSSQ